MVQKEFKEIVFEFAKRIADLSNVQYVFLFGSVARGNADKRSDVDFCIIIKDDNKKGISEVALDLEKKYDKNIQLVISRNFEGLEEYFMRQLFEEGIILFARKSLVRLNGLGCEKQILFVFSLDNLGQSEKMQIKRILYGYETAKKVGKNVYRSFSEGLIKELNGIRLGKGSVLIPAESAKHIEDILKTKKVKYKKLELFKPVYHKNPHKVDF